MKLEATKRTGRPKTLTANQRKKAFTGTAYKSDEELVKKFGTLEAAKQAANKAVRDLFPD